MIEKDKIIQELKLETKINDLEKQLKSIMSSVYYQSCPAKTDKSLEIASIPTSIHFALPLEFIVSHCFTHKNNSLDCFYLRSLYFTIT